MSDDDQPKAPLVTEVLPLLATLTPQYTSSDATPNDFLDGLLKLSKTHPTFRAIRGDGSCFYRSVLFMMCEGILSENYSTSPPCATNSGYTSKLEKKITESLDLLSTNHGYDKDSLSIFCEEFLELLTEFLGSITLETSNLDEAKVKLLDHLSEVNGVGDYCTWYLRMMVSLELKSNSSEYLPFILPESFASQSTDEDAFINQFCKTQVEPTSVECDNIQISALSKSLEFKVNIYYLDGRHGGQDDDGLVMHSFGEAVGEGGVEFDLLYRPGHFDCLYKAR
jgi:hypothetical protein